MRKYLNKTTVWGTLIGAFITSIIPLICAVISFMCSEIALRWIVMIQTDATVYYIAIGVGGILGGYIANRRKRESS